MILTWLVFEVTPDVFAPEPSQGFSKRDEANARQDIRTATLQLLGGLLLALGAVFTARTVRISRDANRIQRAGQLTERFTAAVEQLAHQHMEVRVGGIYALGQIAAQSSDDHDSVIQILAVYARDHAPWPPGSAASTPPTPPADIQAIAAVLRSRNPDHRRTESRLDLHEVDFHEAFLLRADLRLTRLTDTNLQSARLVGANLARARLGRATLAGALMAGTDLRGAYMAEADLRGADLRGADLRGADLSRADLRDTILAGGVASRHPGERSMLDQFEPIELQHYRHVTSRDARIDDGTQFDGAKANSQTDWPAQFDAVRAGVALSAAETPPR